MLSINCSLNCIYQNDGKCTLNKIPVNRNYNFKVVTDCIYFDTKKKKNEKTIIDSSFKHQ